MTTEKGAVFMEEAERWGRGEAAVGVGEGGGEAGGGGEARGGSGGAGRSGAPELGGPGVDPLEAV